MGDAERPLQAARAGLAIGPYRLIARLGAGAMGEVWQALDTRLDRAVALKLLPSAFAADPDRRARMLREAKAAAAVPHPNVVTLFDIGSDGGLDYLVMELVEGRTLADRLREGRLPPETALDIAIGVTDALAAAHGKGILHRDVKAANVMLTRDGAVKVLDFGLAKLRSATPAALAPAPAPAASADHEAAQQSAERVASASGQGEASSLGTDATVASPVSPSSPPLADVTAASLSGGQASATTTATQQGAILGTPAYFSPEQVMGQLPDERSEIFSVGVLLHELATGKNPFAGREATLEELFRNILAHKLAPAPDVPESLAAVIGKALAREPAERFASMAALSQALRAVKDELYAPARRPIGRWIAAAALAAALVAAAIAWYALRPAPRPPGERYLDQALQEYDVFFNEKATSSLRAAMRVMPDDPRPYAYIVLMQVASDDERKAATAEARARAGNAGRARDRAVVDAAITLATEGPGPARAKLAVHHDDRELAFWDAELAWQAAQFDDAEAGYRALLASPDKLFVGRIYDHYTACLLYRDKVVEAVATAEAYTRAFPGEADALGTMATAYAAAGRLDDALRLAIDAATLDENEDTLAGLAKIRTLRGELREAEQLYRRSVALVRPGRRPLRRATLAMLLLDNGRIDDARKEVTPCVTGGEDSAQRTVPVCLLVAGLVDPASIPALAQELDAREHVTPPSVPYGHPAALARLLRARQAVEALAEPADAAAAAPIEDLLRDADDLYATYHLPFFSSYQARLRAELALRTGDAPRAVTLLEEPLRARPADAAALLALARAQYYAHRKSDAVGTLDRLDRVWSSADADALIMVSARKLRERLFTL